MPIILYHSSLDQTHNDRMLQIHRIQNKLKTSKTSIRISLRKVNKVIIRWIPSHAATIDFIEQNESKKQIVNYINANVCVTYLLFLIIVN